MESESERIETTTGTNPLNAVDRIDVGEGGLLESVSLSADRDPPRNVEEGALAKTPLRLRGYPASDSEKLLLVTVSRAIERLAHELSDGTLRVGFHRLSHLVDEPGTHRVYERLCGTDLDVHTNGVEDTSPPAALDLAVHTGTSRIYRRCWFVVFEPTTPAGRYAGLFAIEHEPNRWDGF